MNLLSAHELSRFYTVKQGFLQADGVVRALNDVSFSLNAGETLAIVGESGSGKSTLARLLVGLEAPTTGEIRFQNQVITDAASAKKAALSQNVRMIFQNPYASLNPRWRVYEALEEPLILNTSLSSQKRREKIYSMLQKVGLDASYANRYPHMFSGGQRQRIAIARSLMLDPKVIVADEAVSALDVSIQAQILNLLTDLKKELGLAFVFISHDLSVVEHVADSMLVMYFGRTVEYGDAKTIFQNPKHPYTRFLLSATPKLHRDLSNPRQILAGELPSPLNPPIGCPFNTRCPKATSVCYDSVPQRTTDSSGRSFYCFNESAE